MTLTMAGYPGGVPGDRNGGGTQAGADVVGGAGGGAGGGAADGSALPRLEVTGVTLRFGGLTSLDDVSFRLDPGTVLAVIGPNGAGKTSLFNCLTGVYRPQRGRVRFRPPDGRIPLDVLGRSPHAVTRLGMARTFQHTRLFGTLNAFENVQVGVESQRRAGALRDLLPYRLARGERDAAATRVWELLDAVGLADRAGEPAASLPYGEQRRLEIARALGTRPSLLLLDEPAAGASAQERRELADLVRRIADSGISVLLIEHDVPLVMSLATSVVVLNFGRVIAVGTPEEVRRDPAVVEAYLGVGHADAGSGDAGSGDAGSGEVGSGEGEAWHGDSGQPEAVSRGGEAGSAGDGVWGDPGHAGAGAGSRSGGVGPGKAGPGEVARSGEAWHGDSGKPDVASWPGAAGSGESGDAGPKKGARPGADGPGARGLGADGLGGDGPGGGGGPA